MGIDGGRLSLSIGHCSEGIHKAAMHICTSQSIKQYRCVLTQSPDRFALGDCHPWTGFVCSLGIRTRCILSRWPTGCRLRWGSWKGSSTLRQIPAGLAHTQSFLSVRPPDLFPSVVTRYWSRIFQCPSCCQQCVSVSPVLSFQPKNNNQIGWKMISVNCTISHPIFHIH